MSEHVLVTDAKGKTEHICVQQNRVERYADIIAGGSGHGRGFCRHRRCQPCVVTPLRPAKAKRADNAAAERQRRRRQRKRVAPASIVTVTPVTPVTARATPDVRDYDVGRVAHRHRCYSAKTNPQMGDLHFRSKLQWLGEVEAASPEEAITKGAEAFEQSAKRLMAVRC